VGRRCDVYSAWSRRHAERYASVQTLWLEWELAKRLNGTSRWLS
jgi:hypothetical protein